MQAAQGPDSQRSFAAIGAHCRRRVIIASRGLWQARDAAMLYCVRWASVVVAERSPSAITVTQ
jgi:hypothetical protein